MKTSNRVKNVYKSILNGEIPGEFSKDQKQFTFPVIKTIDRRNNSSTWQITVYPYDTEEKRPRKFKTDMLVHRQVQENPNDDSIEQKYPVPGPLPTNIIGIIHVTNTTHTGKERSNTDTEVKTGKNLGKKNATNSITQALQEAFSLYKNKMKSSSECLSSDMPLPMLVKKIGETRDATLTESDFQKGVFVERKYDGYRSIVAKLKDQMVIYSRTAIEYTGLDKICNDVKVLLGDCNLYIDGELYSHNTSLQDISAKVRNGKSITLDKSDIKLYIFDCYDPNHPLLPQKDRKEILNRLFSTAVNSLDSLVLVESIVTYSDGDLEELYKKYVNEGYEGAIIRKSDSIYEPSINNHHSSHVLKMKPYNTAEYKIIGYTGGLKGKDTGALIFIMETSDCNPFNAVPSMTLKERKSLYKTFQEQTDIFDKEYKGKMATIQYSIISRLGVPQQPKFITVRDPSV